MNQLIRYVDSLGLGKTIYDGNFLVTLVFALLFLLWHRHNYHLSKKLGLILFGIFVSLSVLLSMILSWIVSGFSIFGPSDYLRTFIFNPLICLLAAKVQKMRVGVVLDVMTPTMLVLHGVGHIACPFLGCCVGISCSWGIWNPVVDEFVFPTQWLITLIALSAAVMIVRFEKRNDYEGSGRSYPIMLVSYGSVRFFVEFLKYEGTRYLGVTRMAIQSILMVLVGVVWLFTLEEIKRENNRKAEHNRQSRRIYSPQRASTGYPKEDKV